MITLFTQQMELQIGTCLWTWVKALLESAGAFYGSCAEWGAPVNGHKVNQQPCTWMPLQPLRRKWILGENQPELFSRSLVLGHFLSGCANCNNLCRNNRSTNPIWPSFFLLSLSFSADDCIASLLFCPAESRAWIDDLMNLKRARQIIAVNLTPAH